MREKFKKWHLCQNIALLFAAVLCLPEILSAQESNVTVPYEDGVFKPLTSDVLSEGSNLVNYGSISLEGEKPIRLNSYSHFAGEFYWGVTIPILVTKTDVSALSAELLQMGEANYNNWYFTSVPFDVKVRDIVVDAESQWLIRIYDGRRRAALKTDTWRTLTADDEIKAGQGFILHWEKSSPIDISTISFKGEPSTGTLFAKDDVPVELESWPSELAHTDSWNLIGNPYPCLFNIKYIEHEGLLTIWNTDNKRYEVYSPADDDVIIAPFKSFFVQRTSDRPLVFHKEGRKIDRYGTSYPAPRIQSEFEASRKIYNFYLTRTGENEYSDRTRLVINENAKYGYDKQCDAPKFESLAENAAEIYTLQDGLKMAINERPSGNFEASIGVSLPEAGDYIINLDGTFEHACIIEDCQNGVRHNFKDGEFRFHSDAGEFKSRFTICFGEGAGIAASLIDTLFPIKTYSPEGIFLGEGTAQSLGLAPGVYIEKKGATTRKILNR